MVQSYPLTDVLSPLPPVLLHHEIKKNIKQSLLPHSKLGRLVEMLATISIINILAMFCNKLRPHMYYDCPLRGVLSPLLTI